MNINGKNGSPNPTIAMEAASWITQLDGNCMTDADRLALREWASRSPRHLDELKRMGDIWLGIDELLATELIEYRCNASISKTLGTAVQLRPMMASVITACLIGVLVFTGVNLWQPEQALHQVYKVAYSVPEGQNKRVSLTDGSKLHINTNSLVEIEFNQKQRVIRLSRGEAHFEVAHDAQRPFIVYAGGNSVSAIGTAFTIRLSSNETSVIVTEGKIKLAPLSGAIEDINVDSQMHTARYRPALIVAGQEVIVSGSNVETEPTIRAISNEFLEKELAWRDGLIVFDGDELQRVISEVSRYTQSNIVISDPDIRQLPIGGVFKAGEVEPLLGALEASFEIDVHRIDENLIHLKKRKQDNR